MSLALAALGLLALLWIAAVTWVSLRQVKLLFPPEGEPFADFSALKALDGSAIRASFQGQALRYYRVPARGAPRGLLLMFHGNRDSAAERIEYAQRLAPLGLQVVLAEYPGYAGDATPMSQSRFLRNALALTDEACSHAPGLPLFLLGESLGSSAATFVAYRREPLGLILHTPWPSMVAVASARYPWLPVARLLEHPIPARDWAPHVRCPVLVLHGTLDKTVPYALGQEQAVKFRSPLRFITVPGAGHADLKDTGGQTYWGGISDFVQARLTDAA